MAISVTSNLDLNNEVRIRNMPDPALSQDAATKAYVESYVAERIEGLSFKDNVAVAAQVDTDISAPGSEIDSTTMSVGDRVLLYTQTDPTENGIYVWNGAAVPMTRSPDCSTPAELTQAVTTVDRGTSAGVSYRQTAYAPTLGTTSIVWVLFGTGVGAASETAAGTVELATQAEVNTGTDPLRVVTSATLAGSSWARRTFVQNIGDASATSFAVTHGLGSLDVHISVYENSPPYRDVFVEKQRTSTNVVTIVFDTAAPGTDAYRVVVSR